MIHENAEHLRRALDHATQAEAEFRASGFAEQNVNVAMDVTSSLSRACDTLKDIVRDIDRAAEL
jgi:phosphohistidine phosphatase SixA